MTVSILIPAYNASEYLTQCLDSIVNQKHKDLQIVVIDDGSSDDTFKLAKEYAQKDNRIEVYTQANAGVAVTRNNLLDKAKGEYTLFVDADDWIEPEMVEIMANMAISNSSDISMCRHLTQYPDKKTVPAKENEDVKVWTHDKILEKFLFHRELTGSLCNKLIKTRLIHRFTPGIVYGEDAMALWQTLLTTSSMAVTENQYYNYRMNPQSVSHAGGVKKKMSVIPVWESIINTAPNEYHRKLANGRYGAEVTLILYEAVKNGGSNKSQDIKSLRRILRKQLASMVTSKVVSLKFLAFSGLLAYSWPLSKMLS